MGKVTPITEQFQHFVQDLKASFWRDLNGRAQAAMKALLEEPSRQQRDRYLCREAYARRERRGDYRNGYYEWDFVTRFGTLRLRIARVRGRSFLPAGLRSFQRRAEDVMVLIRESFLRGISTRQGGRVVALVTGEPVSVQTVSLLTKSLDRLVKRFQEAPLQDEWAYLFLDGVSLRAKRHQDVVSRPAGRKRVQMLVAYGVRRDGQRRLLAFQLSQGESEAA